MWCKRVCVPVFLLYVSVCAHEFLSIRLWACVGVLVFLGLHFIPLERTPDPERVLFEGENSFRAPCFFFFHCVHLLSSYPCLPLQKTIPSDCQSGLAAIISSSAAPAFPLSIPHSSLCATSVRGISADGAWEKLAVRHIPSLPSPPLHLSCFLPYSALSLSLPLSPSHYFFPCPPLLSPTTSLPLCLVAPLIHYISTPLLHLPPPSHFPFLFSGS